MALLMCRRASPIARAVFSNSACCCAGHLAEQIARLLPVVVIHAMIPMRALAVHRHRRLGEIGLIVPEPVTIGWKLSVLPRLPSVRNLPVAMIAVERAFGAFTGIG